MTFEPTAIYYTNFETAGYGETHLERIIEALTPTGTLHNICGSTLTMTDVDVLQGILDTLELDQSITETTCFGLEVYAALFYLDDEAVA